MTWLCVGSSIELTAVSYGRAAGSAARRSHPIANQPGTLAAADRADHRCSGALPAAQPLLLSTRALAEVRCAAGVAAFAAEGPGGRARQAPAAGVAGLGATAGRAGAAFRGGTGGAARLGAPKDDAALEAHGQVGSLRRHAFRARRVASMTICRRSAVHSVVHCLQCSRRALTSWVPQSQCRRGSACNCIVADIERRCS